MKILYVTTISQTINSFFKQHIKMLVENGNDVDIACNDEALAVDDFYIKLGCNSYTIPFSRSVLSINNIFAFRKIKNLVETKKYDIVHTHTPIASAIVRIACRNFQKSGLKIIYTAHGFHFYKGAPLRNWLLYYPVEWVCAHWTNTLITINKEDFALAKKHMHAKKVEYVPGVGVDLVKFRRTQMDKAKKRNEIGLPSDSFVLMSTGELNDNKNHVTIIRALALLHEDDVHYIVAGIGGNEEKLVAEAKKLGVSKQVHLLGYRNDIPQLLNAADVFCFPSRREGLGLGAIEAMACGLPLLTSNVGGINDYSQDGVTGFKFAPTDSDGFARGILILKNDTAMRKRIGNENLSLAERFSVEHAIDAQKKIYESV